jgi:hypothetical protein
MSNRFFSSPNRPNFVWGQANFLFSWYQCLGVSSGGVRLTYSPPSNARLKEWSYTRNAPWRRGMIRENFVFYLPDPVRVSMHIKQISWSEFHMITPLAHSLISYFCATECHLMISTWKHFKQNKQFPVMTTVCAEMLEWILPRYVCCFLTII